MNKQDLIAALKGGGRTQVDPSIGQVQLTPTLGRYGNYNVVTEPTSKNSSATQLSRALMAAPQIVGQFKNIQEAAGILEANELTTEELETRFNKGDVEADGIFSQLFKDQAFQQTVYTRKFNSEVTPNILKAKAAIKSRSVEDLAGMSDEEYRASVQQELTDTLDPAFLATVKDNTHMARIHNRAMERVIPHTVEELVAWKNKEVKEYTKNMGIAILMDSGGLGTSEYAVPVVDSSAVGTAIPFSKATVFGDVDIDPTTAQEVENGRMAEVKGDPLIGSSGMAYRGLEDSVPTVAVHPKSGLVAGDMIHVVSDLFPDGKLFEVAGTGPASGRLDFFATNKVDYKMLSGQKLRTVTKLDPESIKYEAKAIPVAGKLANYRRTMASAVAELQEGFARIETTDPERATYIGDKLFNDIVFKYEQTGDLETIDAWLQSALDGNEPFIDGPHSASAEGKRLLLRVGNFVEQEEAARERGANTIGGKASERESLELIYRAKKAMADAADAVRNGKDPTPFTDIFGDVYAATTDPENKVLHPEHRVDVLDVLTAVREKADRYPTSQTIDDEQDYQAVAAKNNWTAILRAGSEAENYANLPLFLKDMGFPIGDYTVADPLGEGRVPITDPRIFPLANKSSSKARKDVLDELGPLNVNAEELAAAIEQKSVEDRYKEAFEKHMKPLMLAEFGDPDAIPKPTPGSTEAESAEARAQILDEKYGNTDLLSEGGKLQKYATYEKGTGLRIRTLPDLNRAHVTVMDEGVWGIATQNNSPTALRFMLMKLSVSRYGSKESLKEIGRAFNASPASKTGMHTKLWKESVKTGIPMRIHRKGGLFEFAWEEEHSRHRRYTEASIILKKGSWNINSARTFNEIETSKERIYNIPAIQRFVHHGDDSALKELAKLYDLDPDKFIPNQLKFAEDIKVIDPQPKPE